MPFPKTLDELREAGYKYENGTDCKGCGAPIEFWRSPKRGDKGDKLIPMDYGTAMPHWSTCPVADQFRKQA